VLRESAARSGMFFALSLDTCTICPQEISVVDSVYIDPRITCNHVLEPMHVFMLMTAAMLIWKRFRGIDFASQQCSSEISTLCRQRTPDTVCSLINCQSVFFCACPRGRKCSGTRTGVSSRQPPVLYFVPVSHCQRDPYDTEPRYRPVKSRTEQSGTATGQEEEQQSKS
jgi:hypothetical protein